MSGTENRRRRVVDDELLIEAHARKTRKVAVEHARVERELTEATLMGMDDGTEEAAMAESIDFSRFEHLLDDDEDALREHNERFSSESPVLEQLKLHRERETGRKITWRR